jgi:hypothetical protein
MGRPFERLAEGVALHQEHPPAILFKYLPPERADVFERRLLSFTPPSRFNDVLEFSPGTQTLAGSRFRAALFQRANELVNSDFLIKKAIEEGVLPAIANWEWARRQVEPRMPLIKQYVEAALATQSGDMLETLNALPWGTLLRDGAVQAGMGVLCLTEEPHSPVMWSHYSKDYSGFVLAFNAFHPWFWFDDDFERPRVLKVQYNEEVLGEFLDIVGASTMPFLRKRPAWSHEHEWRMFEVLKNRAAYDEVNEVSLFEVPSDAIIGVLMGYRMPSDISDRIIAQKVLRAPNVQLRMVRPNYAEGFLESVPIGAE